MSQRDKSTPTVTRRDYLREHLRQVPAFRALVRSVECRLFEQASEQIGGFAEPVLDIGCGDGLFASLAFTKPLFAGIDPNEASLKEARARLPWARIVISLRPAQPDFPFRISSSVQSSQTVSSNTSRIWTER